MPDEKNLETRIQELEQIVADLKYDLEHRVDWLEDKVNELEHGHSC